MIDLLCFYLMFSAGMWFAHIEWVLLRADREQILLIDPWHEFCRGLFWPWAVYRAVRDARASKPK